jgi:hypothetical protein
MPYLVHLKRKQRTLKTYWTRVSEGTFFLRSIVEKSTTAEVTANITVGITRK